MVLYEASILLCVNDASFKQTHATVWQNIICDDNSPKVFQQSENLISCLAEEAEELQKKSISGANTVTVFMVWYILSLKLNMSMLKLNSGYFHNQV